MMFALAALIFLIEFLPAFSSDYEYFLDELYYLACAKRLAFGYIDHPPLAPLILRFQTAIFGDSVLSLRLLPALAASATVLVTGWMTHRLGGGRLAQAIAALSFIVAPVALILFGFFSMNCFEVLLWTLATSLVLELNRGADAKLWLALGLVLGLAFENKHTSALLVAAIAIAILASPLRGHLRSRSLWLGATIALLLVLPNLYWQWSHDWVSLEFYANLNSESNIATAAWAILADQILVMNPFTFPVWCGGLGFCLFARGGRHRPLGLIFLICLGSFMASGASRPDRVVGVYPVMFAAGGVWIEALAQSSGRRWLGGATLTGLSLAGLLMVPLSVPWPPSWMARIEAVASTNDSRREVGLSPIPLPYAHRLGSREFVAAVATVYQGLSDSERADAVIVAGDFAHAGALELYGPRHSLPPVFSPHNNYYLWGPAADLRPSVVIAVALDTELLRESFESVVESGVYGCEYCMAWRTNLPIYLARGPRLTLAELWPEMRRIGLPTRKLLMLDEER